MLKKAEAEGVSLQRKSFQDFGKNIELFKGVKEWFKLINACGKKIGVEIEHYVNSSGLIEMIEGTPIAKEFKKIFACSYLYDIDGKAIWPAVAVNYTTKTQFLFKINKGIDSIFVNKKVNDYIPDNERRVPFTQMVYFGDGETDIPCMKLIKEQGGHSIAVYKPRDSKKIKTSEKLIIENRVNFACPADYSEGSEIFKVVKTILEKIKADHDFQLLLNLPHLAHHRSHLLKHLLPFLPLHQILFLFDLDLHHLALMQVLHKLIFLFLLSLLQFCNHICS
jgi:hypothetical protein